MGNVYLLGGDIDIWETFNPSKLMCVLLRHNNSFLLLRWYYRLVGHHIRKPDPAEIHRNSVN